MSKTPVVIKENFMEELDGLTILEAIKVIANLPSDSIFRMKYYGDEYSGSYALVVERELDKML